MGSEPRPAVMGSCAWVHMPHSGPAAPPPEKLLGRIGTAGAAER